MSKGWRWLAASAVIIGLIVGWLLLWRRRARPALPQSQPKPDEVREDRIVLPLSRSVRTATRLGDAQRSVKGEITLPGGESLAIEAAPSDDDAWHDTSRRESQANAAPEPQDDRIELPLHAVTGRPVVGKLNGADEASDDEEVGETGDEVSAISGGSAGMPDGSIDAYCVRCKTQRPMVNVTQYVTSKNRAALKGECSVCGAGMFKFIKE